MPPWRVRKYHENIWQGVGILKQLARLCQQYAKGEGRANEQRQETHVEFLLLCFWEPSCSFTLFLDFAPQKAKTYHNPHISPQDRVYLTAGRCGGWWGKDVGGSGGVIRSFGNYSFRNNQFTAVNGLSATDGVHNLGKAILT